MYAEFSAVLAAGLRRLPNMPGRGRGARFLHTLIGKDDVTIRQMKLGYKMRLDPRSRTEVKAYYFGDFDTHFIRSLRGMFEPNWIVLDVGANIGFWSVPFAQQLARVGGRGGALHCFEPVPGNQQRLRQNLTLNNVTDIAKVHDFGLSDQNAELKISLREDFEAGSHTGNASIVIDKADERFQIIPIQVKRLDDVWPSFGHDRLDLVKLDIEGHEDHFLAGAHETIARHRPLIFMEINEAYFERRGMKSEDFILPFFKDVQYSGLFWDHQKWVERPLNERKRSNDDILLCPLEKKGQLA